jgi:hypothetical protein
LLLWLSTQIWLLTGRFRPANNSLRNKILTMYEEFINTEAPVTVPSGEYYVSTYGRFGYFVNFMAGFWLSGFLFAPFFHSIPKPPLSATLLMFFIGLGSWWLMIYSCSQFFRKSPRFVLDDSGFFYRGLLLRIYVPWQVVESLRTSGGRLGFVYLNVRLCSASRWRKRTQLDVSGMVPDYKALCEEMKKHISLKAIRNGWI